MTGEGWDIAWGRATWVMYVWLILTKTNGKARNRESGGRFRITLASPLIPQVAIETTLKG